MRRCYCLSLLLVPAEFTNLLQFYTKQGFRVIGAAHKQLKVKIDQKYSLYIFPHLLYIEGKSNCHNMPVKNHLFLAWNEVL